MRAGGGAARTRYQGGRQSQRKIRGCPRSLCFSKVPFLLLRGSVLQQGQLRCSEVAAAPGHSLVSGRGHFLRVWLTGQVRGTVAMTSSPPRQPGHLRSPALRVTPALHPGPALLLPGPSPPPGLCTHPSLPRMLFAHSFTVHPAQGPASLRGPPVLPEFPSGGRILTPSPTTAGPEQTLLGWVPNLTKGLRH